MQQRRRRPNYRLLRILPLPSQDSPHFLGRGVFGIGDFFSSVKEKWDNTITVIVVYPSVYTYIHIYIHRYIYI